MVVQGDDSYTSIEADDIWMAGETMTSLGKATDTAEGSVIIEEGSWISGIFVSSNTICPDTTRQQK